MLSDQEKSELQQHIRSNTHEIFVVSIEEMDAIVRSSSKSRLPHVKQNWQEFKDKAELGASYYASAGDLNKLQKLIADLGSPSAQVYVKTYGGKPHIILKGRPGLRKILTGTKYGIKNPKVIAMGLGQAAANNVAKSGGVLTVVLLTGYRVTDYVLTDQATLSRLIGSLATDVVKVGITVGASIAASIATGAIFSLAIGPLLAVIGVGLLTSALLNIADDHFGITDKLIATLDGFGHDWEDFYESSRQGLERKVIKMADGVIDYAIRSAQRILVDLARHHLGRFGSGNPRASL